MHVFLLIGVLHKLEHLVIGEVFAGILSNSDAFLILGKNLVFVFEIFESNVTAFGHICKDISQFFLVL